MFTLEDSYISDNEGTRIATMSQEDGIYKLEHAKREGILCCRKLGRRTLA